MWRRPAEPEVLELAAEYNIITGVGRIFGISSMILNSAFRGYGDTKTPPDADIHTRWTMAGREIWNTWRISTQSIFQGPLKSMRNSLSRKKATWRP